MPLPKERHNLVVWFTLLLLCTVASAQSGRRPQPKAERQNPDSDVELRTQEVLLAVTVRDVNGRPVTNLTRDDFIVAEDRVRQDMESFSTSRVPVNVVLVLDASGSVFSELASIRKAAASFVDALGPEDQISVIQFADKVELIQDWTTDHESVRHALSWRYKGGEATKFWDAVFLAADEQLARVEGRRAMIILSDGVDTKSRISESLTQSALDRAGAVVYVVSKAQALIEQVRKYTGVGGKISGVAGRARSSIALLTEAEANLRELADRYGGRMYSPLSDDDLANAYRDVADELKQQYIITYVPKRETQDGRWRSIDIFLSRPGLIARTRKGYVAGTAQ